LVSSPASVRTRRLAEVRSNIGVDLLGRANLSMSASSDADASEYDLGTTSVRPIRFGNVV